MSASKPPLASLPSVDRLLRAPSVAALPRTLAVAAVRTALADIRERVLGDGAGVPSADEIAAAVVSMVQNQRAPAIQPVLNATGVVLHTNLGRAPLAPAARAALADAAQGYGTVEFDLVGGGRGQRLERVAALAAQLCGAEDAVVVNNNAAAVLLMLTALARGRGVVVSRGELVEIGGSFRIPDVAEAGGARLLEVGATNRTRLADYSDAIDGCVLRGEALPAGLLKVHRSNFRIVGFTAEPERRELAQLAHERGLWLAEDLGSGNLLPEVPDEPTVDQVVAAGVDLVSFSGDKLLGGPQAGIIVGKRDLVRRLRRHPLYRALRLDKLVLAALDATLRLYAEGRQDELPTVAMFRASAASLASRCRAIVAAVGRPDLELRVREVEGRAGAGALPGRPLRSAAVVVAGIPPHELARALRGHRPIAIGRQHHDELLLDPRTLLPEQDALLAQALRCVLHRLRPPPVSSTDSP